MATAFMELEKHVTYEVKVCDWSVRVCLHFINHKLENWKILPASGSDKFNFLHSSDPELIDGVLSAIAAAVSHIRAAQEASTEL